MRDNKHLDDLPKVHPREGIVHKAQVELSTFLFEWRNTHGLTNAEWLTLVSREIHEALRSFIATERRNPSSVPS